MHCNRTLIVLFSAALSELLNQLQRISHNQCFSSNDGEVRRTPLRTCRTRLASCVWEGGTYLSARNCSVDNGINREVWTSV
jgi:hypothetical protein